jgi:hypothetical protein
MKNVKMGRSSLKELLKSTNGRFFSVQFRKKDGSLRNMTARIGVKKYLKGGENKVEAPDRPYVTVYDVQNKGYRTINVDTLETLKAFRKEYKIQHEEV